jgi:hypothetical protein
MRYRFTVSLLLLPFVLAAGCGAPGGSDEATVTPDPKAALKTAKTADGSVEVTSPAPPKTEP